MTNGLYTVVLEVLPGRTPGATRLRWFLKRGLRAFGIRCLSIRAVAGDRNPGDVAVGGDSVPDDGEIDAGEG